MSGSLGMAATMQPLRHGSLAGQRLVTQTAFSARSAVSRQKLTQCRSMEAGAPGGARESHLTHTPVSCTGAAAVHHRYIHSRY
jgi:hypothetical protein